MNKTITPENLDTIFEALGHQHRRDIIYSLGLLPHSISQLAAQQNLSLPAIHKHIKVLKDSGLIKEKKIGRTHVLTLNRASLRSMQEWLMQFQTHWGSDEETLENYADYVKPIKEKGAAK
jgi:DNA-binding transcriptional ArsR family regulator